MFAGLATGIGSAVAFLSKRMDARFLSGALGFSAGVMIYVSMIEIFFKARDSLASELGKVTGYWYTTAAFFGGMAVISLIDKLVPSPENSFAQINQVLLKHVESADLRRLDRSDATLQATYLIACPSDGALTALMDDIATHFPACECSFVEQDNTLGG